MGDADANAIHRELGKIGAVLEELDRRMQLVEQKQDKLADVANDVKHMRANVAMMKAPVEDYKRLKERGIGAYVLLTTVSGGIVVLFNIISYVIRVFVLGIDKS